MHQNLAHTAAVVAAVDAAWVAVDVALIVMTVTASRVSLVNLNFMLTLSSEHEKQAAHGWGGNDGNAELADEQAGEAIAKQDEKAAVTEDAQAEAEPEPEDKTKSYDA